MNISCKTCEYRDGDYCHNYEGFSKGNFTLDNDFCSRWEPKIEKGAWTELEKGLYCCSECGKVVKETDTDELNFCPKCGAKMVEIFWRRQWTNIEGVTSARLNTSEGISL